MRKNNKKTMKTLKKDNLKSVKGGHYDTGACPPWHYITIKTDPISEGGNNGSNSSWTGLLKNYFKF